MSTPLIGVNMVKIGIGISTTPNRKILKETLKEWEKYKPIGAKIIVENDRQFTGVAATKNRLLKKLDSYEHIFLVDDDVKPLSPDWWKPYVESKENHLMYQFKLPGKPKGDMRVLSKTNKHISYSHTRGAFIYIHRIVLDMVGGMDERYKFGFEHPDWTNRIHNAGLTSRRAMDVVGSEKLLYCYDQDNSVQSSVSEEIKRREKLMNHALYKKSKTSSEWKPYK